MYTKEEVEQLLKQQAKLTLDQHYITSRIDDSRLLIVKIPNKDRRTGKTTRTIDQAIQNLFKNKILTISKDYDERSDVLDPDARISVKAQDYFISGLLKRLGSEHFGQFEIVHDNRNILRIQIKTKITLEKIKNKQIKV